MLGSRLFISRIIFNLVDNHSLLLQTEVKILTFKLTQLRWPKEERVDFPVTDVAVLILVTMQFPLVAAGDIQMVAEFPT